MLKFKVSKKEIKNNSNKVIKAGYCELQYLLTNKKAFAYSSGVYGWACDYYNLGSGVILSTGYSPIGESVDWETSKKFDNEAKEILFNCRLSYEEKNQQISKLLNKFIETVA